MQKSCQAKPANTGQTASSALAQTVLLPTETETKWSSDELANIAQMPKDLQEHLRGKETLDLVPAYQEPVPVLLSETIHPGSCKMTAFFPVSLDGETEFPKPVGSPRLVLIFYPGGWCFDEIIDGDHKLACHTVKRLGCIGVCVDRLSTIEIGIRSTMTDSESAVEIVRGRCANDWHIAWDTDPWQVVIVGISLGATIAVETTLTITRDHFPPLALILIVPLLDTNPTDKPNPWGKNANTPGLSTDRILRGLEQTCRGVSGDDSHYNPSKIPDSVLKELPPTAMVIAQYDPLCESATVFYNRLRQQKYDVSCKQFADIHQVKDLPTAEGQALREFVVEWLRDTISWDLVSATKARVKMSPDVSGFDA